MSFQDLFPMTNDLFPMTNDSFPVFNDFFDDQCPFPNDE
jgi:hypothetical protein